MEKIKTTKRLAALLCLVWSTGCIAPATPRPVSIAGAETIRVRTGGRVVSVSLEEYVLGSALSEVSPVNEPPATVAAAFELQSILARTYALSHLGKHRQEGFDLCDSTHCQIYEPGRLKTSRFAAAAREAVQRTKGVALVFAGRPAEALYHSDCGGHTAAADRVWGGKPVAYLGGAADDVPAEVHRTWNIEVPIARLREALNADARSSVGRRLDQVTVAARDASGRAARIGVRGERVRELSGELFRSVLNQTLGDRAVMSTRFKLTRAGAAYQFSGTGFGHGVGLCQVGALARARRGEPTALILAAYFPGTGLGDFRPRTPRLVGFPVGYGGALLLKSP